MACIDGDDKTTMPGVPVDPLSINELALLPLNPILLLLRVLPSFRNSLFRLMTGVSEKGKAIFIVSVLR